LPNIFAKPGSNDELTKYYGLDYKTIFNKIVKRWFNAIKR